MKPFPLLLTLLAAFALLAGGVAESFATYPQAFVAANTGCGGHAGAAGGTTFSFRAAPQVQAFAAYPQAVVAQPLMVRQNFVVQQPVAQVRVAPVRVQAYAAPAAVAVEVPRRTPLRNTVLGRRAAIVGY